MLSTRDVLDIIAPIRERLAVLETDVAHLKRKAAKAKALPSLRELMPLVPWVVALIGIAVGHWNADVLKGMLR